MFKLGILLLGIITALTTQAATYYVNSSHPAANDSHTGLRQEFPLKSLNGVQNKKLLPGDTVAFHRSSVYPGQLIISQSGTELHKITFTSYGEGFLPVLTSNGSAGAIIELRSRHVVIENLKLLNSQEGIRLSKKAEFNLIRKLEISEVGIGMSVAGKSNQILRNSIQNLRLITSTPGGMDDYGAIAFLVSGPSNEVAFNRCLRCKSESLDFGTEGSMFELQGDFSGTSLHHNRASDSAGFFRVHNADFNRPVQISFNEVINSGFGGFQKNAFSSKRSSSSFVFENNTISDSMVRPVHRATLIWNHSSPLPASSIVFRNNIVSVHSYQNIFSQEVTRSNNIYHLPNSLTSLFSGENTLLNNELLANPLFVNVDKSDLRLQAQSPAIDRALTRGLTTDLDGRSPFGAGLDIGAFEYHALTAKPSQLDISRKPATAIADHSR